MALALTTAARVKERKGITGESLDSLIGVLITEVSMEFEAYMARHTTSDTYTEVYTLDKFQRVIPVRGAPVSSVTTLKINYKRDMSGVTATSSDSYDLDASAGTIMLRVVQPWNPGYAEVVYEGGMAADSDAFILAYPDIAGAADAEVINRLVRRENPTGESKGRSGAVTHPKDYTLLRNTVRVLSAYRKGQAGGRIY